jgi:hypothetical protein
VREKENENAPGEHIVQMSARDARLLEAWLKRPNGSLRLHSAWRVTFEAVQGGGVLVRTLPYDAGQRAAAAGIPGRIHRATNEEFLRKMEALEGERGFTVEDNAWWMYYGGGWHRTSPAR